MWMSECSELRFLVSFPHISRFVSGPQEEKVSSELRGTFLVK